MKYNVVCAQKKARLVLTLDTVCVSIVPYDTIFTQRGPFYKTVISDTFLFGDGAYYIRVYYKYVVSSYDNIIPTNINFILRVGTCFSTFLTHRKQVPSVTLKPGTQTHKA